MNRKVLIFGLAALAAAAAVFEPTQTIPGKLGGDAFFEGRPTRVWLKSLASEDVAAREAAVGRLESSADAACVDVLRQVVVRAPQAELRWTAVELLGKKKGSARTAAPELLKALDDSDPHVRSVAATALPETETPAEQAVPALIAKLHDQSPVPVIRALSRYAEQAQPATSELVKIMKDASLPEDVRWNAIRTLGKMREAGADAIPEIVPLVKDPATRIREHAAEALGDIGPPSRAHIPLLVSSLADPDVKVRRDSVRSIGQIGVDADSLASVMAEVEKLVKDPEEIVRDAAKKTLQQLRPTANAPVEK
ncbi:MAG: HEAT repeat domain-containing protein [Pirellulales bacterium]